MRSNSGNKLEESGLVNFTDLLPEIGEEEIRNEILEGLTSGQKWISSKFFYDKRGSELFSEITMLDEYYPTRTEISILREFAPEIMKGVVDVDIIELGSGDGIKISVLINIVPASRMPLLRYVPVDVSKNVLLESGQMLSESYPSLRVEGVRADFLTQLNLIPSDNRRLICFFGSTIGNLSQERAHQFIKEISDVMRPGERLILGLDMVKPRPILEAAYNDKRGVTAVFNRNILNVVNRLAATDFNPRDFTHLAFYNDAESRIEMHLKANRDFVVKTPHIEAPIPIYSGETIHTENSHKYTTEDITAFAGTGEFAVEHVFTDPQGWFSLVQYVK